MNRVTHFEIYTDNPEAVLPFYERVVLIRRQISRHLHEPVGRREPQTVHIGLPYHGLDPPRTERPSHRRRPLVQPRPEPLTPMLRQKHDSRWNAPKWSTMTVPTIPTQPTTYGRSDGTSWATP